MHAHNSAFSISTKSGTARELSWGPGNASSHSRGPATPGVLTEWLQAAKAISGMPFPSHGVCCWVLSALVLQWTWDTLHLTLHSQVCCSRSELSSCGRYDALSSQEPLTWDTQRYRGTPCIQKHQNNNLSSNHWTPIPLPPSSSSSHPHCSQKWSSGTSRVFPWHSLYSQAFKTRAVFPAKWRVAFWTAEFDDSRTSNVLKL